MIVVGVDSPAVYVDSGTYYLTAKQLGILRAMRFAVQNAEPGDIIVQEDHAHLDIQPVNVPAHHIASFVDFSGEEHMCPRAFQVPEEPTRELLMSLWGNEGYQSCLGWEIIPKVVVDAES